MTVDILWRQTSWSDSDSKKRAAQSGWPEAICDRRPAGVMDVPFFGMVIPFFGTIIPFFGTVIPFFGTIIPFFGRSVSFLGTGVPFFGRSVPNIEFPNLQFPFLNKPHRPFSRFRATPAVRAAESAPFHQRPQQATLCWPAQIRRHGADPFGYFEWVFEKFMTTPPEEQLEELLPANWLKTRPDARQTIESRAAWMPEPPDLWQKCQRCSVERLRRNEKITT
jgi:hypothetical protein